MPPVDAAFRAIGKGEACLAHSWASATITSRERVQSAMNSSSLLKPLLTEGQCPTQTARPYLLGGNGWSPGSFIPRIILDMDKNPATALLTELEENISGLVQRMPESGPAE